jgi:hypothetical protein
MLHIILKPNRDNFNSGAMQQRVTLLLFLVYGVGRNVFEKTN